MNFFRIIYSLFQRNKATYEYFTLSQCRGNPAFSFGLKGSHPHLEILKQYLDKMDKNELYKNFKRYYDHPVFLSAADIYYKNINKRKFEGLNAYAMPFPWETDDSLLYEHKIKKGLMREARLNYFFGSIDDWWTWGGHATDKKIKIEIARYRSILLSFLKNGYNDSSNLISPITGTLVISKSNERVVVINSGQHRCVIASIMGVHKIKVRVDKVVFFTNSPDWPMQKNGIFSSNDINLFEEKIFSPGGISY